MSPIDLIERALRAFRGAAGGPEEACYTGEEAPGSRGCHPDCDSVRLTELTPGARGTVTCLEEPWSAEVRKLTGMGVLPGAPLQLLQRYPVHVVRLGKTDLAMDEDLAARIRVRVELPEVG